MNIRTVSLSIAWVIMFLMHYVLQSYGQPPNGNYSHAWPAEPPGGVPVSHTQHL